jgi:hypothetical protein
MAGTLAMTELESIQAPSAAKDFIEGFAIGIGIVAAIVACC